MGNTETTKSGWTTLLYLSSTFGLLMGFFLIMTSLGEDDGDYFVKGGIIFLSSFNGFFVGFLVNVLTDIRHYLKTMCENSQNAS